MEFRKVKHEDFGGVINLIKEFYEESIKEFGSTIDLNFLIGVFDKLKGTSFLAEKDGKVVGLLAGEMVGDLLSGEATYAEIMWFVSKDHRSCGARLLRFVEKWVTEQGIKRMMMVHMCNAKEGQLREFYARLGYRPMEVHYIKELTK